MRLRSEETRIVRAALRRFVACSVLAFVVAGAGSVLLAHHIAYDEGSRDALLQARVLARGAAADLGSDELSALLSGYVTDGPAEHIALIDRAGRVLWSDATDAAGRVHLTPWARSVLAERRAEAGPPLSSESAAGSAELVDVYVGVTGADGTPVLVVATMPVPVRAEQWHLVEELIPLALAGLVAFALASGGLAISLARRVEGGLRRQAVLERKAFLASDLERRRLARDLHDGVIQELSAARYALPLVEDGLDGAAGSPARRTLTVVDDILGRQLVALRTLMMDMYPAQLDDGGLTDELEGLARTARASGLTVDLDPGNADTVRGDEAGLVYRVVREGLTNVVRHAGASKATVSVRRTSEGTTVRVEDDGCGPTRPRPAVASDDGGHLGVVLLRDALEERGGGLELAAGTDGGAVLTAWLPPAATTDDPAVSPVSEARSLP